MNHTSFNMPVRNSDRKADTPTDHVRQVHHARKPQMLATAIVGADDSFWFATLPDGDCMLRSRP